MKRLTPSGLKTFLLTNPPVVKADLFVIALPNGTTIYVTEGQFNITVPSGTPGWTGSTVTFLSSQYGGWYRGPITSEATSQLNANSMSLTCVPQQGTVYPGTTAGILAAAVNGLFDTSQVTVYTCYMPVGQWNNVSYGLEKKFFGFIDDIEEIDRTMVEFNVQDPFFLFKDQIPKRLAQSSCQWQFCDSNCTLSKTNYIVTCTVKSGSTNSLLIPSSAFTQATGYFTQGEVTFTSGNNSGFSMTVKLHDTNGHLQLTKGFLLPVNVGDTFTVMANCDRSIPACSNRTTVSGAAVNNLVNFEPAPAMPVPTSGEM